MRAANILLAANQPQNAGQATNASQQLLGLPGLGTDLEDDLQRQLAERRKQIIGDTPSKYGAVTALFGTAQ